MIYAIELENFKGIGERQRIELAPLTLLFGANSAGKSTILHAVALLGQVLRNGDADIDRTIIGGDSLNLGGFRQYVHGHDLSKRVCIRIEFATQGSLDDSRILPDAGFLFPDLDDDIERAWIEVRLGLGWSPAGHHYCIAEAMLGINGISTPLLEMHSVRKARPDNRIEVGVNVSHPYILSKADELVELLVRTGSYQADNGNWIRAIEPRGFDSIPDFHQPVRLHFPNDDTAAQVQIESMLTVLLGGTFRMAQSLVTRAVYVGPLRQLPPRSFQPERSHSPGRWANGLGAWDHISRSQTIADDLNRSFQSLGIPYKIAFRELAVLSSDAQKPAHYESQFVDWGSMLAQIQEKQRAGDSELDLDRIFELGLLDQTRRFLSLHDVGVGISQIVPVIAACHSETGASLVLMEQPELHIHPALQVSLGDLFIATSHSRQMIIETHSEHIILRLLRRIRQTGEANGEAAPPSSLRPEDLSVLYAEAMPEGARIRRLRVDTTGEFVDEWPAGFFEERSKELF